MVEKLKILLKNWDKIIKHTRYNIKPSGNTDQFGLVILGF